MTVLDIGIIVVAAVSVLIGFARGFVREALSIVSWVASIWIALTFCEQAGAWFARWVPHEKLQIGTGFAVLLVVSLLVCSLVSYVLHKLLSGDAIKGTDRTLGGLFGGLRAALIIGAFVLFVRSLDVVSGAWWRDSSLRPWFDPVADMIEEVLPPQFKRVPDQAAGA